MAQFKVYSPRGYSLVRDLSSDLINLSYTEAAYGSLEGNATIEVTDSNRSLLQSMTEASHFCKVSSDSSPMSGSIVKDCYIDKGIAHISIIGFLEYLEIVPAIASHKANSIDSSTTVLQEDPSWTKIFYSDSTIGLFWEVFNNLRTQMTLQGFTPFFSMSGISSIVEQSSGSQDWTKSYRLNTLETPNMAEIYSDLTEDDEFLPIRVTVDASDTFTWKLTGLTSYNLTVIDEATDDVHTVSKERGDRTHRAMSLASGSDLKENALISKLDFSSSAAYSSAFSESPAKSALNITRANRANIAGANRRLDQLTFTTWDYSIPIFGAVSISGQNLPTTLAVVTQKVVEGQSVTYTATIVDSVSELIPGLRKPTSEARRLIFEPAKLGNRRSIRQGLQKQTPTGWR